VLPDCDKSAAPDTSSASQSLTVDKKEGAIESNCLTGQPRPRMWRNPLSPIFHTVFGRRNRLKDDMERFGINYRF